MISAFEKFIGVFFFMEVIFYNLILSDVYKQLTEQKNQNQQLNSIFIDQSESTVLKFKCRGKIFVEAIKPQMESLKNQIDNLEWFV